jgi:RNA polymerase sigma factor (sigma-70 family)
MLPTELIKGCIALQPACQRKLVEVYAPQLMTVCRRYATISTPASDLLQEAFIKIFHSLHQYDDTRGEFIAWMKRIVINLAITQWRKDHKKDWSHNDLDSIQVLEITQADHLLHAEDLLALIAKLPAGYRVVFNLHAVEGYSHQEIAQELGITESTSRSQLTHARRFLRDLWDRQNQQPVYEP